MLDQKHSLIDWRSVRKELPNVEDKFVTLLLCRIYVHDPTDVQVEHYYFTGYYYKDKFMDMEGKECRVDYWAVVNEPVSDDLEFIDFLKELPEGTEGVDELIKEMETYFNENN